MAEIHHLVGIKGAISDVYAAIATTDGLKRWWSAEANGTSAVGDVVRLRFGEGKGPDIRIEELQPDRLVRWTCVAHEGEWVGTEFTFALREADGQVYVRFTQAKWRDVTESLAFCTTKWAAYLLGLKALIETETGRPYPNDLRTTHS